MAPVSTPGIRHVRTGKYDRARAVTECRAAATDADYSWRHARDALLEGRADGMCLACRSKLEAYYGWRDLSHLSDEGGSSTSEQHCRIRQLVREADQHGCFSSGMPGSRDDIKHLSNRAAAALLDELNIQKAKRWKRRPLREREFDDTALNDFVASLPKGNGTRAKWAIVRCHIKTLAQLKATDPYEVFSVKNAGVGVIKVLLDAGVWPGVSLSSATRKGAPKIDLEAVAKTDREFLLALEAEKNTSAARGFQKLLQLGTVQTKRVPPKVPKMQAAAIAKTLRALSTILDTNQKVALMQILQDVAAATNKKAAK